MKTSFRIVSLVPSLTEALCDLGLQKMIVGCTKYCISPKSLRKSSVTIGGTKDPNIEKIISLSPTHIIMNDEENTHQIRTEIKANKDLKHVQIIETFPKNAFDAILLVVELGKIFACEDYAEKWSKEALFHYEECKRFAEPKFSYIYFIWRNPWMVAGNTTYISKMLELIGLQNRVVTSDDLACRYPVIQFADEQLCYAQLLLFSSEPYPFKKRHVEEFLNNSILKGIHCLMVDGQNLSWYGTRTLKALKYILELKREILSLMIQ